MGQEPVLEPVLEPVVVEAAVEAAVEAVEAVVVEQVWAPASALQPADKRGSRKPPRL
ncbi:MAG: hypothetical protein Q8P12_03630 [bacterium]|nr:hypothetical protein [bacterium]